MREIREKSRRNVNCSSSQTGLVGAAVGQTEYTGQRGLYTVVSGSWNKIEK